MGRVFSWAEFKEQEPPTYSTEIEMKFFAFTTQSLDKLQI